MARKPAEFVDHPHPFPEPATFRGVVKHVVDGDTFDALIDLGVHQYAYETLRLRGVDTPEIYRPADAAELERGRAAKAFVEELILDMPCVVTTHRDRQSFGRYEADLAFWDPEAEEFMDLAQAIRDAGFDES